MNGWEGVREECWSCSKKNVYSNCLVARKSIKLYNHNRFRFTIAFTLTLTLALEPTLTTHSLSTRTHNSIRFRFQFELQWEINAIISCNQQLLTHLKSYAFSPTPHAPCPMPHAAATRDGTNNNNNQTASYAKGQQKLRWAQVNYASKRNSRLDLQLKKATATTDCCSCSMCMPHAAEAIIASASLHAYLPCSLLSLSFSLSTLIVVQ